MNDDQRKTEMEKIVREFNALLNEEILENHKLREELRSERREKEYYKLMLAGKKRKIIDAGLFIWMIVFNIFIRIQFAHAETLPQGCYETTGSNECYETTAPTLGFYTHNILPANQEIDYYGQVVASLLDAYFQEQKELKLMTRKYNLLRRGIKK